ncbi:cupin domain-containing protein [Altericista sp. CCNU0014]|uniref:cupin domain-containing protein n=1 Tax=Altericista sp. CCNU0014 TaxID=3082949 RepID=UPI00385175B5
MEAYNLQSIVKDLPELKITPDTTFEEAMAAHRMLTSFDRSRIGLVRYCGDVPWERHLDGDELLYVLDGELDLKVLPEGEPICTTLKAGSIFVVPKGLWHRPIAPSMVTLLFSTPVERNEHSFAEDPRV